ncbi:uncharacterized protein BCR38DRAFT_451257, partial [Pseudomassariella vexata]
MISLLTILVQVLQQSPLRRKPKYTPSKSQSKLERQRHAIENPSTILHMLAEGSGSLVGLWSLSNPKAAGDPTHQLKSNPRPTTSSPRTWITSRLSWHLRHSKPLHLSQCPTRRSKRRSGICQYALHPLRPRINRLAEHGTAVGFRSNVTGCFSVLFDVLVDCRAIHVGIPVPFLCGLMAAV